MSTSSCTPLETTLPGPRGLALAEETSRAPVARQPAGFFRSQPSQARPIGGAVAITGIGRATTRPGALYPPNGYPSTYNSSERRGGTLSEYRILLITDGAGELQTGAGERVVFQAPAILTLFPGTWHRYQPLSKLGWTERWISFDGGLAHKLFGSSTGRRSCITPLVDAERLCVEFDLLLDTIRREPGADAGTVMLRALNVIVEMAKQTREDVALSGPQSVEPPEARRVEDPVVRRALSYIWAHSQGSITVGDVARHLSVTRRTLARRFTAALGHSVLKEIFQCRMSRAKHLLTSTDRPVKSVARLAGFPSTERMRVAFVESEGVPPHTYRQQQAGRVSLGLVGNE